MTPHELSHAVCHFGTAYTKPQGSVQNCPTSSRTVRKRELAHFRLFGFAYDIEGMHARSQSTSVVMAVTGLAKVTKGPLLSLWHRLSANKVALNRALKVLVLREIAGGTLCDALCRRGRERHKAWGIGGLKRRCLVAGCWLKTSLFG